jgi:hypothetical protein
MPDIGNWLQKMTVNLDYHRENDGGDITVYNDNTIFL